MTKTKLFLVQFLIEADVTNWPEFDEAAASAHFTAALKLSQEDKKVGVQVYLLARKPDDEGDLTVEQYEDRGYDVEICQNAHTVGTDVPAYFAMVGNPQAKTYALSVVGSNCATVEEAKAAARLNVDRRVARQERKDGKKE